MRRADEQSAEPHEQTAIDLCPLTLAVQGLNNRAPRPERFDIWRELSCKFLRERVERAAVERIQANKNRHIAAQRLGDHIARSARLPRAFRTC